MLAAPADGADNDDSNGADEAKGDSTGGATVFDAVFGPSRVESERSSPVNDDGRAMRPGAPTAENGNRARAITEEHCAHVVRTY